jgi:MFS family permease
MFPPVPRSLVRVHPGSGRKTQFAIVAGCAIYGLGTLATVWATNIDQVVALRVLTGVGLGGLMPNAIALK